MDNYYAFLKVNWLTKYNIRPVIRAHVKLNDKDYQNMCITYIIHVALKSDLEWLSDCQLPMDFFFSYDGFFGRHLILFSHCTSPLLVIR